MVNSDSVSDLICLGIPGLDKVLGGGVHRGSFILVMGNPGSGKTIFSTQFLFEGATNSGEKGMYVSFSENKKDYFENMRSLGLGMEDLEAKGLFRFLDFPSMESSGMESSVNIMMEEMEKFGAKRLVIDSVSALSQAMDRGEMRRFLHVLFGKLIKEARVTTLMIGEIPFGAVSTEFGITEFVADGVFYLKTEKGEFAEKKEIVIAKMRGAPIERSVFEYLIDKRNRGIGVIALPKTTALEVASKERLTTGIKGLDEMLSGGVYRDSITLIEGGAGIGKTTLCLQFLAANARKGEKCLFISFEEPIGQLKRLLESYKIDYRSLGDKLSLVAYVPEAMTPLHYYSLLSEVIERYEPTIMAFDSITAIQHTFPEKDFLAFMRYLQLLCRTRNLTVFTVSSTGTLEHVTISGISSLADNIIMMQYYQLKDRMARELMIIKTRASPHEKRLMTFDITAKGIVVNV